MQSVFFENNYQKHTKNEFRVFSPFSCGFSPFSCRFSATLEFQKIKNSPFQSFTASDGANKAVYFVCFCKNPKALASFEVPFSPHSVCTTQITNGCSRCSQNELARTIPGSLLTRKVIETATLGTYLGVSSV